MTLLYVKYQDHILFRNVNPGFFKEPCIREAIGWIIKENDEALWICFDKPVKKLLHKKMDPASGLLILKSNILEKREIE